MCLLLCTTKYGDIPPIFQLLASWHCIRLIPIIRRRPRDAALLTCPSALALAGPAGPLGPRFPWLMAFGVFLRLGRSVAPDSSRRPHHN